MILILKNTDSVLHTWGGQNVSAGGEYTLQRIDYERLINDTDFIDHLNSGIAVISDTISDLSAELSIQVLKQQVILIHKMGTFNPGVGINAPAIVEVNGATSGYQFAIGDRLYSVIHFDNLIGATDHFEIHHHACIDNSESDRWIQWKLSIIATTGELDNVMTACDIVIISDPIEVPTTPNLIFKYSFNLPSALVADGKDNLFIGWERVAADGKTAPTNDVIVLRVDEVYYQKIDVL